MSDQIDYRGHVIEARPKQLADSDQWTDEGFIELHRGQDIQTVLIASTGSYATRDEAISA